ncbi:cobalamin B12-binding domain-containing protein [Roseobacter sp. EG26]|uniref:cobalamin B12-binding domain-containing protein n=1 Tax=Roseobacter sp. EG26 TaxID=3412477 RepID=UPI003CE50D64
MQEFEYSNGSQSTLFTKREFDELCDQLLCGTPHFGEITLLQLMSDGMSKRDLYLRVLLQAARQFGFLWDENEVSYLSVQLAMLRIEGFLEGVQSPEPSKITQNTKQAILASIPGDSHTIGAKFAADTLRSMGWDIDLKTKSNYSKLMVEIDNSTASILALSIGSISSTNTLQRIVKTVQLIRPETKILISGPLVEFDRKLFDNLKIDGLFSRFEDAEDALNNLGKTDPGSNHRVRLT